MTDPIMGDEGKLYNGVTEHTIDSMRRLVGVADVIVPNLTEAEFLTGLFKGLDFGFIVPYSSRTWRSS